MICGCQVPSLLFTRSHRSKRCGGVAAELDVCATRARKSMFWNATTVPTAYALFGTHRPTIGILRIMSLSSWPRTWQCHRYHALVLGSTAATGHWLVPGWTPPEGVSWGAHRVISRRTSPRLARAVSFHPVS